MFDKVKKNWKGFFTIYANLRRFQYFSCLVILIFITKLYGVELVFVEEMEIFILGSFIDESFFYRSENLTWIFIFVKKVMLIWLIRIF